MIILSDIKNSLTYPQFMELIIRLVDEKKTSGELQSEEKIEATRLNAQRMKRIDKLFFPSENSKKLIGEITNKWNWIVLAEAWCGDGAQIIPIIAKLASLSNSISLSIVLRDENPTLMNKFLTDGKLGIPKLICVEAISGNLVGTWGPRPTEIMNKVVQFKQENPTAPHSEFLLKLHTWYAQDKGISIEKDLVSCMSLWNGRLVFDLVKT